jgi:hypothetical protein
MRAVLIHVIGPGSSETLHVLNIDLIQRRVTCARIIVAIHWPIGLGLRLQTRRKKEEDSGEACQFQFESPWLKFLLLLPARAPKLNAGGSQINSVPPSPTPSSFEQPQVCVRL